MDKHTTPPRRSQPDPIREHKPTATADALQGWQVGPAGDPLARFAELIALGYSVTPVAAHAKQPPRGFAFADHVASDAPVTLDTVRGWLTRWPDCQPGILCGPQFGLMVLDLDTAAALAYADVSGLPDAPTVRTRRGLHVYFQCPEDVSISYVGKNALIPGLEIKADGMVLAPGCIHPSGTEYTAITPLDAPRPDAPDWLLQLVYAKQATQAIRLPQPASTSDRDAGQDATISEAVGRALGVRFYNAAGWSHGLRCPFHDDAKNSASYHRSGKLYCHAGCRPGHLQVSAGHLTFGFVDVARAINMPLPMTAKGKDFLPESTAEPVFSDNSPATVGRTFPPSLYVNTPDQKDSANGEKFTTKTYYMVDPAVAWQLENPTYAALSAADLGKIKHYRAALYSMFEAGTYRRADMAGRVGVSAPTARAYDKTAGVIVVENIDRHALKPQEIARLGDDRSRVHPNVWFESTAGHAFPPTLSGHQRAQQDSIDHDRRTVVYRCCRLANTYKPPTRADRPLALPVEVRQAYMQAGRGNEARVLDALLTSGVQFGQVFTRKEAESIVARYGISKRAVKQTVENAPPRGQGASDGR